MKLILPFLFFISIGLQVAIGQNLPKKVMAIKGDGVYSLLRKNNLDPIKYYKAFLKLNKKKLSENNGLFIGQTYILPQRKDTESISKKKIVDLDSTITKPIDSIVKKTINSIIPKPIEKEAKTTIIEYPIFGKNNAAVIIENKNLDGAIYYLISGHGGPDPGATETYRGKLIAEDEYAYDVTLRLAKLLLSNGAKVYIIIKDPNDGIRNEQVLAVDYDEINYPDKKIPLSQKSRLRLRTQAVNNLFLKQKSKYQRLIVTHIDSRSKGKNIDVFFYHHKNSKKGKSLAENIHNAFKQKYAKYQPNKVYSGTVSSRSNLYLVRNTLPPMVYIELGNIKSKKDQKRILNYQNREALAKWIFNGLEKDYKNVD